MIVYYDNQSTLQFERLAEKKKEAQRKFRWTSDFATPIEGYFLEENRLRYSP